MSESGEFLEELSKIATEFDLLILEVARTYIQFQRVVRRSDPLSYFHPIITVEESQGKAMLMWVKIIGKGLSEVHEP